MMNRFGLALAIIALGSVGMLIGLADSRPDAGSVRQPRMAHGIEPEAPAEPEVAVSETEMLLFIEVYKAMQSDHSVQIETAIAARGSTLGEFRKIERRIQASSPLVERVRASLLEHAKQQSVLAASDLPLKSSPPAKVAR